MNPSAWPVAEGVESYELIPAILIALAFLLGLLLSRRSSDLRPFERLLMVAAPGFGCIALVMLAAAVSHGATFYWNPPRIAPIASMFAGYPHYHGPEVGPVLNTIYPPMSSLAYFPVGLATTTFQATIITAIIGGIAFYLPVALLLFSFRSPEKGGWLPSFYATLFFLMVGTTSYALRGSAFFQPVDPIALGLSALAGLALFRYIATEPHSRRLLSVSAVCAVLAVWSKQTMAPIGLALPTFLLAACGWQHCRAYLVRLALFGIALSLLFLLVFPVDEMIFNIWTLPSAHPFRSDRYPFIYAVEFLRSSRETFFVLPLALAAIGAVGYLNRQTVGLSWRRSLAEHPWLLFAWIALLQLPTSYLGFMKEGGRANSFTPVLYFITIVASVSLLGSRAFPSFPGRDIDLEKVRDRLHGWLITATPVLLALSLGLFCILDPREDSRLRGSIVIVSLGLGAVLAGLLTGTGRSLPGLLDFAGRAFAVLISLHMAFNLMHFSLLQFSMPEAKVHGPVIGAYSFAKAHPGEVYFPYDPLTTLLTDGKLYHFDYGLYDRRLAGEEISDEHFREHIPARLKYVLYPRWTSPQDSPRESFRYLVGFRQTDQFSEMSAWWDVFMLPE